MPESKDKPIERLLRSAAAKRRAQAGSPEIHPATRETLLTEVRRQYGAAAGRTSRPWWMRLAPALAVLVILAGGTWIVLRNEPSSTMDLANLNSSGSRQNALEKRGMGDELAAEVTLDVPRQESAQLAAAPALGEAAFAPMEQPVRQPAYPATPGAEVSSIPARTDLALAPLPTSLGTAETFADAASPRVTKSEAPPSVKPMAPPAPEPTGRFAAALPLGRSESSNEAAREPIPLSTAQASTDASQNVNEVAVPVLQNFVVATRDQRVWFIDEDGSVYEGLMQPAPAGAATEASDSRGGRVLGVDNGTLAPASAQPRTAALQTVSYTFDASGINQSLRRSLRFTGQMVLTEQQARQDRNAFANTLPPGQQRAQAGQQSYSLPAAGVDGTLRLDDGTTLRVQAVPATP